MIKVVAVQWRSALHTVGFVAYETGNPANPGEWNSVVGYVPEEWSYGEKEDAEYIAAHGAKLEFELAMILFPDLDIRKHKYIPEDLMFLEGGEKQK